jgi:hypothetical protein
MKLISHRGNINGPQKKLENHPNYIDSAIHNGFDVEIDLWYHNNTVKLGHDKGQYSVSLNYLLERKDSLWIHCKNEYALSYCMNNNLHCFFHDTDAYTLTSKGFIWAYPGSPVIANHIFVAVKPEETDDSIRKDIYAVCSDYVLGFINV